jgi:hypothetical protein
MANPEHLELLRQVVADWNEWRAKEPDLAEANLTGTNQIEAQRPWPWWRKLGLG